MASTIESPQTRVRETEGAVLQDGDETIIPTHHLSGVDFAAHLYNDPGEDDARNTTRRPLEGEAHPESGAHAVKNPADSKPVEKSNADHANREDFDQPTPALKRLRTAPAQDSRRPQPLARSSTLLRNIIRRTDDPEPTEFTFDPTFSDSELDSSGEEDAEDQEQGQKPPTLQRALTEAEEKEETKEKQRAKEGRSYSRFRIRNENFNTKGRISKRDGRLNISVNETANSGYLAKALGHTIMHHLDIPKRQRANKQRQHRAEQPEVESDADSIAVSLKAEAVRPRLNIVIIVIGSRGDIQPFLKVGTLLRHSYGHRVRIATHPVFREFVEKETDLEFFSVGGDPAELMSFMVKNPGLVPNLQTIREGEIQRRRTAMGEMFSGMWHACTNVTEDSSDVLNAKMAGDKLPFIADAIIANPPSMAHVHIAERLGIPLHIMFTFPYTPTQAFPHPLANIRTAKSNVDESYVNFMSYPLVEMMTWQGLGDIVNRFRVQTLGLEPVSSLWAPGALYRMKVPYTYMWSPSLVSKPNDWGPEIDVTGFVFMELAGNFHPSQNLVDFLDVGEAPVYIGFGSIVVEDPNQFTRLIVEAVKIAGVRALINKGWGGLGTTNDNTPDNIFMLENTPHDWLFPKVKAVIHHGGAGTTAMGLKCAKPTMIVPFFGDQPFWGAKVAEARAGAHECIPWKNLTAEKLAEGIKQCLSEEAQRNVEKMAEGIAKEGDAAENACKSFHRSLPLAGRNNMRCSILEDRVAVWSLKGCSLRLSALAAEILLEQKKIKYSDLKLFRVYSWNDFDGPGEPITGAAGAMTDSLYEIGNGVGMVPVRVAKHMKKRADHERKKLEIQRRKAQRKAEKLVRQQSGDEPGNAQNTNTEQQARRPGNERKETNNTLASALSADPTTPLATELARDFGDGLKKSGAALLTMPNDLHVAIAQGFHNAPRLWGDATVRKPIRITGVKSGMTAARKEFVYGIYDAWTGLVTQPIGGFKDGDTMPAKLGGLGIGCGKGVGGFVLKNVSAVISPPAYVGKGVIVYFKKRSEATGPGSKAYIRRAHLIAGQRDLQALQQAEDGQQLQQIEKLVSEGWRVYEEVWTTANNEYGHHHVLGRVRLSRERKRWEEAGALESTHAAEKALRIRKKGQDIEKHFAKRKAELQQAEQPRAPAMEQAGAYEAKLDEKRGPATTVVGQENHDDDDDGDDNNNRLGSESEDSVQKTPGGESSDGTTVVAASEDGGGGGGGGGKRERDSAWRDGSGLVADGKWKGRPAEGFGRTTTA